MWCHPRIRCIHVDYPSPLVAGIITILSAIARLLISIGSDHLISHVGKRDMYQEKVQPNLLTYHTIAGGCVMIRIVLCVSVLN